LLPFLGSVGLLFAVSVRWCHCVPWCPGAAWCAVPPRWLRRQALLPPWAWRPWAWRPWAWRPWAWLIAGCPDLPSRRGAGQEITGISPGLLPVSNHCASLPPLSRLSRSSVHTMIAVRSHDRVQLPPIESAAHLPGRSALLCPGPAAGEDPEQLPSQELQPRPPHQPEASSP
jgi:hypothetical protein